MGSLGSAFTTGPRSRRPTVPSSLLTASVGALVGRDSLLTPLKRRGRFVASTGCPSRPSARSIGRRELSVDVGRGLFERVGLKVPTHLPSSFDGLRGEEEPTTGKQSRRRESRPTTSGESALSVATKSTRLVPDMYISTAPVAATVSRDLPQINLCAGRVPRREQCRGGYSTAYYFRLATAVPCKPFIGGGVSSS